MITREDKVKSIKRMLNKIVREMPKKKNGKTIDRRKWTQAVRERLAALGKEYGYQVAPDLDQENAQDRLGWVYDLTWWRCQSDKRNNMTSIELAAESEWSPHLDKRERDFLKLVYAVAKLKLFIFTAETKNEHEEILVRLEKLANMRKDKNRDKYLFSCFVEKGGKFIHNEGLPIKW